MIETEVRKCPRYILESELNTPQPIVYKRIMKILLENGKYRGVNTPFPFVDGHSSLGENYI